MVDVLAVLKEELIDNLKLNYCFKKYNKPKVTYPYVIGEYIETSKTNEDNRKIGQIILSIFTRNSILEIENVADKIENHFQFFCKEKRKSIVSIEYENRIPNDTNDDEVKKIEVYLDFNKWKGE